MKRFVGVALSGAVLAGALVASVGTTASLAAVCVPSPAGTAAVYLPAGGLVTGNIDATGCQIGVYTDGGTTTITNADIHGALEYGVRASGSSTVVTIANSHIHNIGDVPFNGVQRGVGVRAENGASVAIDNSTIDLFQKNGTVFSGAGTSATITNSTVSGNGPVAYIAQNGIQYSDGATGVARGNLVQDIDYTGCSNKDAAKTGCVPYVATGILLYNIDPSSVDTSNNKFRNDQRNLYVIPAAAVK
jgi:hypothetical protein